MPRPPTSLCALPASTSDTLEVDVLVIGGGVAGFSASIAASASGSRVLCVTKDTATSSNTKWAQGGVAAVLSESDSTDSHRDDTVVAGAGLCDSSAVEVVVTEGPDRIRELIDWGGRFDEVDGRLDLTLEGGHSAKRVVHAHGDQTGVEVQGTLLRRTRESEGVELWEHVFAVDLLVEDGVCRGAILQRQGTIVVVHAGAVILATGGGGQLYRETTNPTIATADGFAMALRAGAELRDMEFIQFHPTTLYIAGAARHLVTEAVRGEGAFLRDMRGDRFMVNYHPDAELAPRDVVSRSIARHLATTGDTHVFLDLTHFEEERAATRFPRLHEMCRIYNIDVTRERIPVHPSAHYLMGGVTADADGRSTVDGLYVCGEVASSGLHGANRLASNSLLEGLVFGRRAGLHAAAAARPVRPMSSFPEPSFSLEGSVINVPDMLNSIKSLMWKDVGIVRRGDSLQQATRRLSDWSNYVFQCAFRSPSGWELVNVLTCAHAVAASALRRTESRGGHFRTDFPSPDDAWRRHSRYTRDDDGFDETR